MGDSKRKDALEIVKRLRDAGFRAYFAGGAVRDMIMGVESEDYDIATDASPEEVAGLFARVVPVGKRFGVSLVVLDGGSYEVAQFRTDGAYTDGRRPEKVAPSNELEDVRRRDFTINALMYDPIEDRILDPVGGRRDIERRIIRTVGDPGERFAEDKLRILRAVRFAARFDFTIEPETMSALKTHVPGIHEVSAERIGEELAKMFAGPHPDRALALLDETGLLDALLPEVSAMKGVRQPVRFHPEGDVFEHTRRMLELFGGGTVTLAFGILLHDVGKPETFTEDDRIRFNRHDVVGAEKAEEIMRRLRFSKAVTERVGMLVRNHMRFIHVKEMRPSTFRRFIAMEGFDELLELFRLDCLASHGSLELYDFVRREMEKGGDTLPEPLISGRDLLASGYEEGPLIGEILRDVMDAQLEGRVRTRREALSYVRRCHPLRCRSLPHRPRNPRRRSSPRGSPERRDDKPST